MFEKNDEGAVRPRRRSSLRLTEWSFGSGTLRLRDGAPAGAYTKVALTRQLKRLGQTEWERNPGRLELSHGPVGEDRRVPAVAVEGRLAVLAGSMFFPFPKSV